jgi:hypothetical protein
VSNATEILAAALTATETITAREAVTRVGLAGLDLGGRDDVLVAWTGYPVPMATGHYAGGLRVSRHFCGGDVLFTWDRVGTVGGLHVTINPVTLRTTHGDYMPDGATLGAAWSGF